MNVLVLETSTSSSKILYYTTQTKKSVIQTVRHSDISSTDKNPNDIIHSLFKLSQEMNLGSIDAIIISSTWHNLMLCDENLESISPAYYWNSNMAEKAVNQFKQNSDKSKIYYNKTGCIPHPQYPYFKLMQLKEEGLDLQDKRITDIGSHIFYLLTQDYSASISMYSGSGLMNLNKKAYDEDLLNELGISQANLPTIRDHNYYASLSSKGKELLGVKYDAPVFLAYPDGALNQIGEQNKGEDSMSFSIGTSAALRIHKDTPVLSDNLTTWCYITPYDYLIGGATSGASNAQDWIKNILFPEVGYNDIIKHYEPTKEYPIFLPFLYSERSPGWDYNRLGNFANLHNQTSNYDLYFAVVEGIIFNTFQTYQSLLENIDKPKTIKLSGGFIGTNITAQLITNVFNQTIHLSKENQQSLIGGIKLVSEFLEKPVELEESFEIIKPDPKMVDVYQTKYKRYLKAYEGNHYEN